MAQESETPRFLCDTCANNRGAAPAGYVGCDYWKKATRKVTECVGFEDDGIDSEPAVD